MSDYFQISFFCYRWLVLTFKREFSYEDALTMFEIISSQHLELSSVEAERERSRQRAKELERDGEIGKSLCGEILNNDARKALM